jgi:hypothetical protein
MLYSKTVIEYRDVTLPAILPVDVSLEGRADALSERRNRLDAERAIDEVLAESFPASDPPSWNPGVSRPAPVVSTHQASARSEPMDASAGGTRAGVIDVSRPEADRTFIDGLISLAGAAGIALLVPFVILLIGMPVALTVRGLLEVTGWLFGIGVR